MAFDEQDREELLSILDRQYKEARRCLNEDTVLPSSIAYNGQRAGVIIEFHKCHTAFVATSSDDVED